MRSSEVLTSMAHLCPNLKLLHALVGFVVTIKSCANCFEQVSGIQISMVNLAVYCDGWVQRNTIDFRQKLVAIQQRVVCVVLSWHGKGIVNAHLNVVLVQADILHLSQSALNYLMTLDRFI